MSPWSIGKSALLTDLAMCINTYRMASSGLYTCISIGVEINGQLEYPDLMVMINRGRDKQCSPDYNRNVFTGPPNFILDILEEGDLQIISGRKKLFEANGVKEYVIVKEDLSDIEWNRLVAGAYQRVDPDENGIIKSSSLPGLWISMPALIRRDFWKVIATIEQGITRKEHHQLMASIWDGK